MKLIRRVISNSIAVGLFLAAGSPSTFAASYTVTELGALSGGSSIVRGVGANGDAVGVSGLPQDEAQGFVWSNRQIRFVGFLPGGDFSAASAINRSGEVAGQANTDTNVHAIVWRANGGLQDLGTLPGDTASLAFAINDAGQVAGYSSGARGIHAFLWGKNAGMQDLGLLPGGDFSEALSLNNGGRVVGVSGSSAGKRAFLWTAGTGMQNLGVLPGDSESRAMKINNSGQIVGSSSGPTGTHAFLWVNGSMQPLGELSGSNFSEALDVNNSGQVVGIATTSIGARAFVWSSSTGMQDLNTLIPANSPMVLTSALGINERGQIVAIGVLGGDLLHLMDGDDEAHAGPTHAFLLTPH